jgi:hypothetical protein
MVFSRQISSLSATGRKNPDIRDIDRNDLHVLETAGNWEPGNPGIRDWTSKKNRVMRYTGWNILIPQFNVTGFSRDLLELLLELKNSDCRTLRNWLMGI